MSIYVTIIGYADISEAESEVGKNAKASTHLHRNANDVFVWKR